MTLWTYWPGPFHWPDSQKDGFTVGVEETGGAVCVVPNEQTAKRIVTAVNSHEELLEALELVKIIPRPWMSGETVTWPEWDSAMEKIDAAIKAAKQSGDLANTPEKRWAVLHYEIVTDRHYAEIFSDEDQAKAYACKNEHSFACLEYSSGDGL